MWSRLLKMVWRGKAQWVVASCTVWHLSHLWCPGLFPMTHSLHIFGVLVLKFTPFKFVLSVELTLWIWQCSEGWIRPLKLCTVHQPEEVETFSPSFITHVPKTRHVWTTFASVRQQVPPSVAVILVAVPCCQLSYIFYVYRHCDILVLKTIILHQCLKKKLKKKSFKYCHIKGLVLKVN